ncbi:MAG: fluoride efflux transporter CrcB [Candidatus Eisenbacteria bacterium]|uniref:Fluoride-specific ion channel FluC n=1 Tax=Eiseniibacteriota bacterium TaxID=2212470 RepID=A0A956SE91_UNCEI|nr:fluoride efflux transporter CrcB [Candidatus Eisenbacteria bacterium]MCB9465765.1 fluoride efflux transporter CrcB [Candidatus Eisenbacteria bacterium]
MSPAVFVFIALGGAIGACGRYAVTLLASRIWPEQSLPIGTLGANILGCLLIGVLAGLAESRLALSPEARSFLFVGLLGGFTTFSSFGLETLLLLREGSYGWAALYVLFQVGVGLVVVAGGYTLGRLGA